jgi:hypothetical protein
MDEDYQHRDLQSFVVVESLQEVVRQTFQVLHIPE